MKKSKLLLVPLIAISASLGVMTSSMNSVNAENNKTCPGETFRDTYLSKIIIKYDKNQAIITNNSSLNLTYSYYSDGNTTEGELNNGATITLPVTTGGEITYFLKEDMTSGCEAPKGTEIGRVEINSDGLQDNNLYNDAICVNYRNKWANVKEMKEAVPHCFSPQTYTNYTKEEVSGWINIAESYYQTKTTTTDQNFTSSEGYQKVDDPTNIVSLMCDAFKTNNYETMHKYYYVGPAKKSSSLKGCETTCKEEIEVNFSDPVATQAGMCFQYLIEIKSKVVCKSTYKGELPKMKQVCYPSPSCVSGKTSYVVGGPNEDFDNCVQSCDNGEYSQKCINKCYNQVYKNKKTTTKKASSVNSSITANLLTFESNSYYNYLMLASRNGIPAYSNSNDRCLNMSATELYNYKQKNPGGHYSGNKWVIDDANCLPIGPYYFRSVAQTDLTLRMVKAQFTYGRIPSRGYTPDGNGILKDNYVNGNMCTDKCTWVGSCPADSVLTETIAREQYEKELKEYQQNKSACETTTNVCNGTACESENTEYKIIATNRKETDPTADDEKNLKDEELEKETKYRFVYKSSQCLNENKAKDNPKGNRPVDILLFDGSCEDGEKDEWNYHNIITFPKAWINNKTGSVYDKGTPTNKEYYTDSGNQFCTRLNSAPVNTAWYEWKVQQNAKELTDAEKSTITKDIEYNIKGKIKNYGYFDWNFDINCFYALIKDPATCTGTSCKDSNNKTSTQSPVTNAKFRSISLTNLFPKTSTGKDRKIGFNWTCNATNLENKDYPVQPVALKNKIEKEGDNVYNDSNIDYEIKLTPETIKKIRAYNANNNKDYSKSSDKYGMSLSKEKSGITIYKSDFLHKSENISSAVIKSGVIGCNDQVGTGNNATCAPIDTTNACYNEYIAQSSVMKGGK